MHTTLRRLTLVFGALALPALASAQEPIPGRGAVRRPMAAGERGEMPRTDVTRILNNRRMLDLTPRQVAQLDSIERVQFAERRATQERLRVQRDSLRGDVTSRQRQGQGVSRDSMRATARARMEAQRPQMEQLRRRDSATRAAAERVLNDTQRAKLREMQAEDRGFQRGLRAGRGDRGPQGMRGGVRQGRQMGPRAGQRPQPGMAPRDGARPQRPERGPQPGPRPAPRPER